MYCAAAADPTAAFRHAAILICCSQRRATLGSTSVAYHSRMIRFTKMQGIGNDYIYVDGFARPAESIADIPDLATRIADRHFGVGADGLILVMPPDEGTDAHVRMRMFNADGSESEMCGNGIRCVCKFAHDRGLATERPMRVQTGAGVLSLEYELDDGGKVSEVTVDMGEPILELESVPVDRAQLLDEGADGGKPSHTLEAKGVRFDATFVSMGNPHAVIYAPDIANVNLPVIGPLLERHAAFPKRMNIHFVHVHSKDEVTMRTWERGSGITMACGTGASAVCVAGVLTGNTNRTLLAHLPGGDLTLRWDEKSNHVFKTGPAVEIFSGEWPE